MAGAATGCRQYAMRRAAIGLGPIRRAWVCAALFGAVFLWIGLGQGGFMVKTSTYIVWDHDFARYDGAVPSVLNFGGQSKAVHSWADLLFEFCMLLYKSYTDAFKKLNARLDFEDIFSRKMDSAKGTRGLPKDLEHPFLNTKMAPRQALDAVRKLADWLRLPLDGIGIGLERGDFSGLKNARGLRGGSVDCPFGALAGAGTPSAKEQVKAVGVYGGIAACREQESGAAAKVFAPETWRRLSWLDRGNFRELSRAYPQKVVFRGSCQAVVSWQDVVFFSMDALYHENSAAFVRATKSASFYRWFAPSKPYRSMEKPRFLKDARIWMESAHAPSDILDGIVLMMRLTMTEPEALEIWVAFDG